MSTEKCPADPLKNSHLARWQILTKCPSMIQTANIKKMIIVFVQIEPIEFCINQIWFDFPIAVECLCELCLWFYFTRIQYAYTEQAQLIFMLILFVQFIQSMGFFFDTHFIVCTSAHAIRIEPGAKLKWKSFGSIHANAVNFSSLRFWRKGGDGESEKKRSRAKDSKSYSINALYAHLQFGKIHFNYECKKQTMNQQ